MIEKYPEVAQAVMALKSTPDIAEACGVSRPTVLRVKWALHMLGMINCERRSTRRRALTQDEKDTACLARHERLVNMLKGRVNASIAQKECGLSASTVKKVLAILKTRNLIRKPQKP